MRTAVSIPDDVYRRAERFAEQTNRSRSRLYSEAIDEYLARHAIDGVTESMNETLAEIEQGHDVFLDAAARAASAGCEW